MQGTGWGMKLPRCSVSDSFVLTFAIFVVATYLFLHCRIIRPFSEVIRNNLFHIHDFEVKTGFFCFVLSIFSILVHKKNNFCKNFAKFLKSKLLQNSCKNYILQNSCYTFSFLAKILQGLFLLQKMQFLQEPRKILQESYKILQEINYLSTHYVLIIYAFHQKVRGKI